MKKPISYSKLAKYTALFTFIIASVICLTFVLTGNLKYGFIGYFFFLAALVFNFILLVFLLFMVKKVENSKAIYRGIKLMLLNIPIAFIYFGIGLYFIGIIRITLENNTGKDVKQLVFSGCEEKKIDFIKNGSSKTIWIDIPSDCSIHLFYKNESGEEHSESIMGYVTSGMGQKITHEIGTENKW